MDEKNLFIPYKPVQIVVLMANRIYHVVQPVIVTQVLMYR